MAKSKKDKSKDTTNNKAPKPKKKNKTKTKTKTKTDPMLDSILSQSLQNTVNTNSELATLNQKLQPPGYLPVGTSLGASKKMLDTLMQDFNLRRGCCLQVPDPKHSENYIINTLEKNSTTTKLPSNALGNFYKALGYHDVTVSFPASYCADKAKDYVSSTSINCQNFYTTYCENMMNIYKTANKGVLDDNFALFRPECACFAPFPPSIEETGINISPSCLLPGCSKVSGVFLDPQSAAGGACDLTLCQANIDFSNLSAGGNITLANKLEQTCGAGGVSVPGTTKGGTSMDNINSNQNPYLISTTILGKKIQITKNVAYVIGGGLCLVLTVIMIIVVSAIVYFVI